MKHLGDITKIHGCAVPITDCVIGGSPCQDLSVAGKREGLAGARSGLFMEQIRIVKEMRDADRKSGRTGQFIRPRYMVWENVPGAFSSNDAEDFRAVLEETARVADANAAIPRPPKKWANAGCIMGDGWSIAWHVLDAQFWGVPQRRRRIALVADFGGHTAPEILFERDGLCWDSAQGGTARERTAADAESGINTSIGVKCLNPSFPQSARVYDADGVWHSLNANENGGQSRDAVLYEPKSAYEENWAKSDVKNALRAEASKSSHAICYPINTQIITRHNSLGKGTGFGLGEDGDPAYTLQAGHEHGVICLNDQGGSVMDAQEDATAAPTIRAQMHGNIPAVCYGFKLGNSEQARSIGFQEERSPTLNAECGGNKPAICYDTTHAGDVIRECGETAPMLQSRMGTGGNQIPLTFSMQGFGDYKPDEVASSCKRRDYKDSADLIAAVDVRNHRETGEIFGTLQAKENGGQSLNYMGAVRTGYAVRRLTPLECERLQGYPDGWTDIGAWTDSKGRLHKESSDSARYKALGNSIALPPWKWVLKRLCAFYERDATLASLFDGIGGFPLVWEQLNGKGSCLWASEIEEFPIAVTKARFAELEVSP